MKMMTKMMTKMMVTKMKERMRIGIRVRTSQKAKQFGLKNESTHRSCEEGELLFDLSPWYHFIP